jgi:hypothetical protein
LTPADFRPIIRALRETLFAGGAKEKKKTVLTSGSLEVIIKGSTRCGVGVVKKTG